MGVKSGIKLMIDGLLRWGGHKLTVSTYTYTEDSTSIDITDSYGGSPQLSVGVISVPNDKRWRNRRIELTDGSRGRASAIARTPGGNGIVTTIQADGRTALMNAERQAQNFVGTLDGAFRYYFGLVGLTSQITIDGPAGLRQVVLPGWKANVFDQVKVLLTLQQLEMSEVGTEIVIRPLRQRIALRIRDEDPVQWTMDSSQIAKKVEGFYYTNEQKVNTLVYPKGGWKPDVQVYQVDAGQVTEFDIPVDVVLSSVVQPTAVDSVPQALVGASVYSVTGTDGLIIPAAQWRAGGGNLVVSINEDLKSLHVVLTGPTGVNNGPFRLAMPSGPSSVYSSLRILGSGIFFDAKSVMLYTGANESLATQDVGATINRPEISTLAQLYDAAAWALARWCGPIMKISLSTAGIQRRGERNGYRYPTIREFNAANIGKTIAQFNSEWAGKSIRQFNDYWNATVVDEFKNQAFGNLAGARFLDDGQWYRVRSASIAEDFSLQMEKDTTIRDFNERYANMTIAQFNAFWAGLTISDFNVQPLRTS